MIGILRSVNRAIHGLNWLVGWFIAFLLALMTALIAWQVFARYVMGSPLSFSEEIARFSMIWMTMLGAGYAFRYGTLISVDLVTELASKSVERVFSIAIAFIAILFAYVLLTEGWSLAERVSRQTAPSTRVSMLWLYAAMPIGAALICINGIGLLIDQIVEGRSATLEEEVNVE